ncbi:MAG: DinB family protein [Bryobacteraceae bacterium]
MRTLLLMLSLSLAATAADTIPLFNGKDVTGWKMTGPGRFVVEDGMLKTEGGMGLLYYTPMQFGNQTIRVVFKTASKNANSGVYIRMAEPPPDPWYGVHNGYEVQIDAGGDDWHCTGSLYSLSKVSKRTQKPMGEWNTMDIHLAGQKTIVYLNGEKIDEFTGNQPVPERKEWFEPVRGPRPDYGYIGLQNHDGRSTVYFKEVSVVIPDDWKVPAQHDREFAMSYLQATRKQFLDMVSGLTTEQWNYKPGPDRWSIAEIAEHLAIIEKGLFDRAAGGLAAPIAVVAGAKPLDDETVIRLMTDRSHKVQAPQPFQPTGRWTREEIVRTFRERRDANIYYMEHTLNNLRGSHVQSPRGVIDCYQAMLMIPSHTARHLAQMQEVKDSAGYPK